MIELHYTNIPDAGVKYFDTVSEAYDAGKKSGFEFGIIEGGDLVVSWSYFRGRRDHKKPERVSAETAYGETRAVPFVLKCF